LSQNKNIYRKNKGIISKEKRIRVEVGRGLEGLHGGYIGGIAKILFMRES
jgi:hypothetical protein